ncbi:MAG: threonine synthase [Ignavibacteria bacterium]|nr:MAG: threonine synthase [Ignavibacteria bacterium]
MPKSLFTQLRCSACGEIFPAHVPQTVCAACGKALVAEYDLDGAKRQLSRDEFSKREGSLWRYRELLPVMDDSMIRSLGEGWTPLLAARRLGKELGLRSLFIKEEGCNPTGSFKARGISVAVSRALELGIREIAMPSAGNAGGALAAYAARAGLKAHVFVPRDTPVVNIREIRFYGAEIYLIDGDISDCAKAMNQSDRRSSWFDMSTMKEPYRLEGKKTMGFELAEQFGWELPDVIIYPTGGGTGLIGMWKAFRELEQLGWIKGKKPRMVTVQAEGCAPIVRAFKARKKESQFWEGAQTVASGLRVPKAFADHLILEALYDSAGCAVSVSDENLLLEMRRAASLEGILFCPEGAAAVAALRQLVRERFIAAEDRVVVYNTGSGYKYAELIVPAAGNGG